MKKVRNSILLLIILLLIAGGLGGYFWVKNLEYKRVITQSDILLTQIENVKKLIAVEGYFTEIYTHKDYYKFDVAPLRKKALIRVKAKASVGFDLSNLQARTDGETKTLYLSSFPPPELLSLDHNLDYYDISEGTFNFFTTTDYNVINNNAKVFIEDKVESSELMTQAVKQEEQIMETIKDLVKGMGWRLEIVESP
ncbi:DUF4230 domain-containing protein [Membranihabitans maritimus]|uniref:DUF4230 domain-containing protein n=1 Tax=Membranihabitans maritimus TaxID=2904244 RepID=UPI001F256CB4|nr:DUF4230 domain-containing protein [Membranihabitans maritimus]